AAAQDEKSEEDKAARQSELQRMLEMMPESKAWEEWLQASGELPPDFSAMPSIPNLPDPLVFTNGVRVRTVNDWFERRKEILKLFEHYVFGSIPPAPENVVAGSFDERMDHNVRVQDITLRFGPGHEAELSMKLLIPPGNGPFPVFITQYNHLRWARMAVSRGYIGCVYAGADTRDDTGRYVSIWPEYDWSKLARRAWAAGRCIDYLYRLPAVDRRRIALAGHSRNGKTSLIAAAIDPRITAVISSSSGAGGACSWRLFSEFQFGEGIELITRVFPDWFHPRLRFFAGREDKLPIDQHLLAACIAPRACLFSTALNDNVESVWAVERTYHSAKTVYKMLNAANAIDLRYRSGGHSTAPGDIEAFIDWLASEFGRCNIFEGDEPVFPELKSNQVPSEKVVKAFPEMKLKGLLTTAGGKPIISRSQWLDKKSDIHRRISWLLGEPPASPVGGAGDYGTESSHQATLLRRATVPSDLNKMQCNFGNYVPGDIYYPKSTNADNGDENSEGQKLPAVVWVHPVSVSNGYVPGYGVGTPIHLKLARAGCAVFAFDQIGNGGRLLEIKNFYKRYPDWSILGKSVIDVIHALDALEEFEFIDTDRVYVAGYGAGGMIALHAAALDERIRGVIPVAGFTPMRLDTEDNDMGGTARWSQWYPFIPRLAGFIENESRVPYDYHEILGMIAPRKVAVIEPEVNYRASMDDIVVCVEEARQVFKMFNAGERLNLIRIDDYNHLSPRIKERVVEVLGAWFEEDAVPVEPVTGEEVE
ncbi:MAG: alpha/beta fold hydrolase, partial [Verrucomicrobia bacterium]|nr:alpha/beta fold hydrolase [Verrucomicrobiota bacterium]